MIAGGFGFVVSLVWCLLLPGVVVFSGCWLFSGLFVVVGAGFSCCGVDSCFYC